MAVEVVIRSDRELEALVSRLKDPRPFLRAVGAMLESVSQNAFATQSFDGKKWLPRYPGLRGPFINIAGALGDFSAGRTKLPARRFQRRPALVDRGILRNSIESDVRGRDTVSVGTNVPYAMDHLEGADRSIAITETTKAALRAWLTTSQGRPFRKQMGRFLFLDSYEFQVIQRPFLGLTDRLMTDIARAAEIFIARGRF